MCTLIILSRPGHAWPMLLAGNRDERLDRAWDLPARHWPDQPAVLGGRDRHAGGSWLASRDDGLVASVMNRSGTLGPVPGRRSRGELVLEALRYADAGQAARALARCDPRDFRPFNLLVADATGAWWIAHRRDEAGCAMAITRLEPGLHMLTAHDLDDAACPRIHHYLAAFRAAPAPEPGTGAYSQWESLLARSDNADPELQMSRRPHDGFGTVCSAIVAVPATGAPHWRHTTGAPHVTPFHRLDV